MFIMFSFTASKISPLNVSRISPAKKLGKQPMAATLTISVTVDTRSHQVPSVSWR